MLRDKEVQNLFEDYYFDRINPENKKRLSYTSNSTAYTTSTYA